MIVAPSSVPAIRACAFIRKMPCAAIACRSRWVAIDRVVAMGLLGRRRRCAAMLITAHAQPYDPEYLQSRGIKHMSFHAYLRKLQDSSKGRFKPLTEGRCMIDTSCTAHAPWPQGICTKCQPDAIILARQPYRHVDFVEFEHHLVVDRFIEFWRASGGMQRIGYLIGRYERYNEVPLGIKAVVVAIYEPPQQESGGHAELLADPHEAVVDSVAAMLGLSRVGLIFTDLVDDGTHTRKVKCTRGADTYFLTGMECIRSARMQSAYLNACRYAEHGRFGSKFVTVVVTGTEPHGDIGLEAYQISNQGVMLVSGSCVKPSKRNPAVLKVCAPVPGGYVPEVLYSQRNEYGAEVTKRANPAFPVDYLLVTVGTGTPQQSSSLFSYTLKPFPVENRAIIAGQAQNAQVLFRYLQQRQSARVRLGDFHFILYVARERFFSDELVQQLCTAVREQSDSLADRVTQSPEWRTWMTTLAQLRMD